MVYAPSNIAEFASTRETSKEIALAIFEIADEGDEARMWEDPSADEMRKVSSRAFEIADTDTDTLWWGLTPFRRPGQ